MAKWLCLVLTIFFFKGFSQGGFHYRVKFKFKASNYSLNTPEEFLSAKSIDRRNSYGVNIDSTDLPICPAYLSELSTLPLAIETKSKWHNCIVVSSSDQFINDSIVKLDFVDTVELIGELGSNKKSTDKLDYGVNEDQAESININYSHNLNYTGRGIDVAIIDAGFSKVNSNAFFDSLFIQGRLKSNYNFVTNEPITYNAHNHGANVLSIVAANVKGEYIGIAPYSNYHLLVSEDINQENIIEEYHLIEALEYCDSAGVEVVNLSLGYSTFDDARFSHNKNELTGDSTFLSKACNWAWKKGAFIVTSAGNSGSESWGVLTSPGNADSIFTIGAVNINNEYAAFSSRGNPSINSILKPNVVGVGQQVKIVKSNETVGFSNGTSFSSPQIAGMAACLYEAFPSKKNWQIRKAIEYSSTNFLTPDSLIGHGLPNFERAYLYLMNNEFKGDKTNIKVFPNPSCGEITITNDLPITFIQISDSRGKQVYDQLVNSEIVSLQLFSFSSGIYFLSLQDSKKTETIKLKIN